ncbi:uncharacterized protein G2W53_036728 [Senna tora]|uniref:Uncharacterized protein n=1 Tax=Senna tora TaxID=362788 RepID=A0A834SWE6_9FABA|nr:uncharacterized protein G2W53_036728 [Senna tora]
MGAFQVVNESENFVSSKVLKNLCWVGVYIRVSEEVKVAVIEWTHRGLIGCTMSLGGAQCHVGSSSKKKMTPGRSEPLPRTPPASWAPLGLPGPTLALSQPATATAGHHEDLDLELRLGNRSKPTARPGN